MVLLIGWAFVNSMRYRAQQLLHCRTRSIPVDKLCFPMAAPLSSSSLHSIPPPAARAAKYGEKDVWGIFTPLAIANGAINLGQGFPNINAPDFIKVR
jgi:hypothetical protein